MAELIQPVKGMNDVLADRGAVVEPPRGRRARAVRELRLSARALARARAHGALQPLDRRATDIVSKEMFTFDDHGDSLTLRPEGDGRRRARGA